MAAQTPKQKSDALTKGNAIRKRRSEVKVGLKRGTITLAEALEVPEVQGMRAYDLLLYLPVLGPATGRYVRPTAKGAARNLTVKCQATPTTEIGALGDRRKRLLLKGWAEMQAK